MSLRADGGLHGPSWQSSAQLPDREVSEHFAQGPICLTDITELAKEIYFACMPGFRAGGALGGSG
eukprot:415146-Pelagomonas_calceolata.AAC.2